MDVELRSTGSSKRPKSPRRTGSRHGKHSTRVVSPKRAAPVLDSTTIGMETQEEITRNRLAEYIKNVEPMKIVKKIQGSELLRLTFNPARGLYVGSSVSSMPTKVQKYTNYSITFALIVFVMIFNLCQMRQPMLAALFKGLDVCKEEIDDLQQLSDRILSRCDNNLTRLEVKVINDTNVRANQQMIDYFDGTNGKPLYPEAPTAENTLPATEEVCMAPSNWMLRLFFPQAVCTSVMDQDELDTRAWYTQEANTAPVQPPPDNIESVERNDLFYNFVKTYNNVAMIVNVAYLLLRHLVHVGIAVSLPFKWRMFQAITGPSKILVTLIITIIILSDFLLLMIPELQTIIWPQIQVLLDPCMSMTIDAGNIANETISYCKEAIMLSQDVQIVEYDSYSISQRWAWYRAEGYDCELWVPDGQYALKVSCFPGCSVQEMLGQFVNTISKIRLGFIIIAVIIFFFEAIICSTVRDLVIILRPRWLPFTLFIDPHLGEKHKEEEIEQFIKVVRMNRIVWTFIKAFFYFVVIIWFAIDCAD